MPQRANVKARNRLPSHVIFPKSLGPFDLQPPLEEEAKARFFFHGLGSRKQRPVEVTRPNGHQIHSPCCWLQCGMQVARQGPLFLDLSSHMCLQILGGTSTTRGTFRGGEQHVPLAEAGLQSMSSPLNICSTSDR